MESDGVRQWKIDPAFMRDLIWKELNAQKPYRRMRPMDVEEAARHLPGLRDWEPVGHGAMGTVFRATRRLGRKVAVKFLNPAFLLDPQVSARFERERKVLERVRHPGLVRLLGYCSGEAFRALILEHVDGPNLAGYMKQRKRLPRDEALRAGISLCEALGWLHDRGVVHRDVKPANVLVDGRGRMKLTDLGIAKPIDARLLRDAEPVEVTGSDEVVGTYEYLAPEHFFSPRMQPDARTDVYALGLVLHILVVGRRARRTWPGLETELRQMDDDIAQVIARAVARDREARHASAHELAEGLRALLPCGPGARVRHLLRRASMSLRRS
jgi:serine/threonine-protein kinase